MNSEETSVQTGELSSEPSWSDLVERVRQGHPSGMEDLYRVFSKGVRFFLCRQLGPQDLDDRVHDLFLTVTQSIQKGELREPERLMGYVRTVVRRQVAAHIEHAVDARRNYTELDLTLPLSDAKPDPERILIERQNMKLAMKMLKGLREREREVLVRFYLKEQAPDQICCEMELSATQFRLIKSRAKARFGELGKRRFSLRNGFHPEQKDRIS
jgi:RNA polymerase sigma-70 factor (ECF subfamily)